MHPYPSGQRFRVFVPQDLRLTVDVLAGCIRVCGELDRSSAHHLADALSALRSSPSPVWTVDLAALTFCDLEGVRVLHRAARLAAASGRGLHLTRVPPAVADLFALLRGKRRADVGEAATAVAASA